MATWHSTLTGEETSHVKERDLPHGFYTAVGLAAGPPTHVKGPYQLGPDLDEDLASARQDNPYVTAMYVNESGATLCDPEHVHAPPAPTNSASH